MSTTRIESIPQAWNDETDVAFFTIVARIFTPEFTYGAGVLLASFDTAVAIDDVVVPVSTSRQLVSAR
jgi:hypothetical protein